MTVIFPRAGEKLAHLTVRQLTEALSEADPDAVVDVLVSVETFHAYTGESNGYMAHEGGDLNTVETVRASDAFPHGRVLLSWEPEDRGTNKI